MSVQVLRCPNCGADLDVVEGVETIRCKFCGARCQLEGHGANQHLALMTQQLGRIEEHAARTAAEIEAMRQQQAHGLTSQFQTDEALRRAAAAQEYAAHESAYAARVQTATHEAFLYVGQQQAAAQEAERQYLLSLHSRYRSFRLWRWLLGCLVMFVGFVGSIIVAILLPAKQAGFGFLAGLGVSVVVAIAQERWFMAAATKAGRKYNERAFLFGLSELPVKSKAQTDWERQTKKAWGGQQKSSVGGCLGLIILFAAGLGYCATKDRDNSTSTDRERTESTPAINGPVGNESKPEGPQSNQDDVEREGNRSANDSPDSGESNKHQPEEDQ